MQPSLREGKSVVVLEAIAAGTLVIASRHEESAVSDLIQSGVSDWLIDSPHDPAEWTGPMVSELNDPAGRADRVEAGRKVAAQFELTTALQIIEKGRQQALLFTWEKTAQSTADVYRRLLS